MFNKCSEHSASDSEEDEEQVHHPFTHGFNFDNNEKRDAQLSFVISLLQLKTIHSTPLIV
jgi:hypothetical protein